MSRKIDRRQALGAIGSVSLGGLLAACGGDSERGSAVTTTAGETASKPLPDAVVDIWHADAGGAYSGFDVSTKVYEQAGYSERGERDQSNERDGIFDRSLVMTTRREGDGYLAVMTFDVRTPDKGA